MRIIDVGGKLYMGSYSYLSHLICSKCNKEYTLHSNMDKCRCGGILLPQYDLELMRNSVSKNDLKHRENTIWRYHELLPILHPQSIVSLHEQITPLLYMPKIAYKIHLKNLLVKDESRFPSGTFKARGAAIGVSKARECRVNGIVISTNGNAGAAWSLYAARAGIPIKGDNAKICTKYSEIRMCFNTC